MALKLEWTRYEDETGVTYGAECAPYTLCVRPDEANARHVWWLTPLRLRVRGSVAGLDEAALGSAKAEAEAALERARHAGSA